MASDLGGTSKLQHPPLQCRCRAWVVLLWEKSFLFTLLISKLLNAHHCYFSQQLLLLKLPNICLVLWLLVELVIVMLSPLFPVWCAAQSWCLGMENWDLYLLGCFNHFCYQPTKFSTNQMSKLYSSLEVSHQFKACRDVVFKRNWPMQSGRKFWSHSDAYYCVWRWLMVSLRCLERRMHKNIKNWVCYFSAP